MTEISFPQYQRMTLMAIAEKLQQDYYETLAVFCADITGQCDDLKMRRLPEASLNYVELCNILATKLQKHLQLRNEIFIPYLKELSDKEATKHNCGNCSGRCELNHSIRLMDMRTSLPDMRELLYNIRKANLQESLNTDAGLRSLHSKMSVIDNLISELVLIEEEHLLPGVEKAQRNIHVAS